MVRIVPGIFHKLSESSNGSDARAAILASAEILMFIVAVLDTFWPARGEVFFESERSVAFLPLDLKFYSKCKVCVELLD